MKKSLIGLLAVALCSAFIFAGCAPMPAAQSPAASQAPGNVTILVAKGEITDITAKDGNTSITVDGSGTESEATYNLFVANVTEKTPVQIDGKESSYTSGSFKVGDKVEIYLNENAPVTASEPPTGTPERIVLVARGSGEQAGTTNAPADVQTEFEGTITEITADGEYYLAYVQKEANGEPANDLRAVVSNDTTIVSEKLEASGLKPEELKVGDKVTVTTDGIMTFSIPPQASAQKIVIHDAQAK